MIIMKKSQAAFEFMALVAAVILFMTGVMFVALYQISNAQVERENQLMYDIATNIKNEIEIAIESYDGYNRNFTINQALMDKYDWDIFIENKNTVVITSTLQNYTLAILHVEGQVQKGENKIIKKQGVVKING